MRLLELKDLSSDQVHFLYLSVDYTSHKVSRVQNGQREVTQSKRARAGQQRFAEHKNQE